jgi:ATP-dependent Lhr-like helicase
MLERLERRGASFFAELVEGLEVEPGEAPFDALWDLVWRGLVTNDTFAPLRALGRRPRAKRRPGRRAPPVATAGRWSLVSNLLRDPPSETRRLHARALLVLDRHGIVSREVMTIENRVGGFGVVYPVLREMEETGRVRRGHFVAGLSSAQFAAPGAVDRLRSLRSAGEHPQAILLAATDPAQPYGVQLAWPTTRRSGGRPRRAVGARVVLVDGRPSLFVEAGGVRALTFEDDATPSGRTRLDRALRALVADSARLGRKRLHLEEIDGEKARGSGLADAFLRAGFRAGHRGLEFDGSSGAPDREAAVADDSLGLAASDVGDRAVDGTG